MTFRLVAVIVALAAACGDDAAPGSPEDSGPRPRDAGAPDGAAPDAGPDAGPHDCPGTWLERIEGTVVDEAGAGVFEARAQACLRLAPSGTLVCLAPPLTEADGSYAIEVPESARCVEGAVMRALEPGTAYGTTYCHVEVAGTVGAVLTLPEPTILYATEPPVTLPPRGDESVERTVVLADGLEIDVVPASLGFSLDYEALGGRRVPSVPCFAREIGGLEGLYVFADEGPVLDGGFSFRIPNATGLEPGASVELLVLGGLDTRLADGTEVEEADFVPFGVGTVSADGGHIAGEALPHFTWLGYRRAP